MARPRDQVVLRTNRGRLIVNADGSLEGLAELVRREFLTGAEVCKLGKISRVGFWRWRARPDFPPPALSYPAQGGTLELWSRSAVEAWLSDRRASRD